MRSRSDCAVLLAAAATAFTAAPAFAELNTAQVCRETSKVLADIQRQMCPF